MSFPRNVFLSTLALASFMALAACNGGSTDTDGGDVVSDATGDTTGGSPSIAISSPMNNATVTLDAMQHVPVSFTVQNFTLMAPGSCGTMSHCGHIHLTIDGTACNASASPYNAAGAASPMNADFSQCMAGMRTGMHTIALELRNDDHSALSPPVTASVTVNVMPGASTPTIAITSPTSGATVSLDSMMHLPVAFTVQNFTLMAPGSCGTTPSCGHVHLTIDGTACNASGAPYNAAGAASPMNADFSQCMAAMRTGMHTIVLELRNDDHSALSPPVSAMVMVNVSGGAPSISITSPTAGSAVTLDSAGDTTIAFTVQNFTLMAPGSCGTTPSCGHVHLLIDGSACNTSGAPYNNAGASSPITAHFGACAVRAGMHTVTLELHNDDHSALSPPVSAMVSVTAI